MVPQVRDAMSCDVLAVAPATALGTVARLLELHGVSGIPVVDDLGRPLGVVTATDLFRHGATPRATSGSGTYYRLSNGRPWKVGSIDGGVCLAGIAADVMTSPPRTIDPQADLLDAAERMAAEHVHRLLVVERGKLIGLIAAMDCLRGLAQVR